MYTAGSNPMLPSALTAAASCLLPAACCLLPAACCLLPAACCPLPAACWAAAEDPTFSPRRVRTFLYLYPRRYNPNDLRGSVGWFNGLRGLSSRFVPYNGGVGAAQLAWLRHALTMARLAGEKVIVCGHVPILPGSCNSRCVRSRLRTPAAVACVFAHTPTLCVDVRAVRACVHACMRACVRGLPGWGATTARPCCGTTRTCWTFCTWRARVPCWRTLPATRTGVRGMFFPGPIASPPPNTHTLVPSVACVPAACDGARARTSQLPDDHAAVLCVHVCECAARPPPLHCFPFVVVRGLRAAGGRAGGYKVDDHGLHHRTLESPLECPPGVLAFGTLYAYADGTLVLQGEGRVPARLVMPPPADVTAGHVTAGM
jgi:hypothetical protein